MRRRTGTQCCKATSRMERPRGGIEHFDVLFVGAGLSGIGAAYHLQKGSPGHSYVILEGREAIGGTWDLFRYPGIRSDSDMYTLGYSFRPWEEAKAIADGPSILRYVNDTADRYGIRQHIRFRHQVKSADWSSADARWTVEAERTDTGERVRFTCNWLHMCSGYYNYSRGLRSRLSRQGKLPRPDRPSAILARGSRLQGQEGGRDRQRRDRGDDRPGDGQGRRPRRHAAALADLHGLAPVRGHASPTACARSCPPSSPTASCAGRTSCCRCSSSTSPASGRPRSRRGCSRK